jgi:hypothetical protein
VIPQADPLFASAEFLQSQVASIQETHVFSPRLLNTATIGFSRAEFNLESVLLASFPSSLTFVTGGGPGGVVVNGGVTTTGIAGITSAGPNNAAGSWNRRNLFTFDDKVQFIQGIHQITAGVWIQPLRDNENSASRQLGQATFTSLTTLLQGTVSTFQVIPDPNELGWRSTEGAWYLEDSIRLRPNLTVRVGVRDEFTTGWNEASGRAANYITTNGVLDTNVIVGHSAFTQNNATHLFAPRVGLAWDPSSDGKTAVRASFGTFYSLIDDLSFLLNSLPPYNGAVSLANTSLLSIIPLKPGIPPAPQCSATVSAPCTTFAPQGVQPNAKTPTVQEWNLTLEHQLNRNTSLRAAYVGSFGYHGYVRADLRECHLCLRRNARHHQRHRVSRPAVHPRHHAPESIFGRWFFLVHRRKHQLQRPSVGRIPPAQPRPPVPRQLHVLEGPRHELRPHRRAGRQSGPNGTRSQRSASRLGTLRARREKPGERFQPLRPPVRTRPPRRMAA